MKSENGTARENPSPKQREPVLSNIRVLVIFGGIPLLGQEKGNLQVFRALQPLGLQCRFITHRYWGHQAVQPELDRLGLDWTTAAFGPRIGKRMHFREIVRALWGIVHTNTILARELIRYRPTHIHVMNTLYILYASPLLFLVRTPLVYRVGEHMKFANPIYRPFFWILSRRVSKVIGISDFVLRSLETMGIPKRKLKRIYNCAPSGAVDLNRTDSQTLHIQHNFDGYHEHDSIEIERNQSLLTAVYCGQIGTIKGVHLIVQAALELLSEGRKLRILLAGNYSYRNAFAQDLIERVSDASQEDSIQFIGYVRNPSALFSIADIHLCPSLCEEGLGNTILEAKESGIPSVIFRRGGMPELVQHKIDGWVCQSADTNGIKEALAYFIDNPTDCRIQGEAARKSARDRFGEEQFRRSWAGVFDSHAESFLDCESNQGGSPNT